MTVLAMISLSIFFSIEIMLTLFEKFIGVPSGKQLVLLKSSIRC